MRNECSTIFIFNLETNNLIIGHVSLESLLSQIFNQIIAGHLSELNKKSNPNSTSPQFILSSPDILGPSSPRLRVG